MNYTITLIPGDGIGLEVAEAAVRVVEATGVPVVWERVEAGAGAVEKEGTPLPASVLESIRRNRVALKGPVTTPIGRGFTSVNVSLRKALALYASIRPVKSLPGILTRHDNVDLVIIRENTEGLYSGREHTIVPGVVEAVRIVSREASKRIARFAFQYMLHHGRRKITVVHKASIMKMSDGLFLECTREASRDYPFRSYEELLIDNTCMQLVLDPGQFDVLLMENLFGDLVSDLCAGLVGGLGLVPGANIGDRYAVFEAVHGSAPDIAGKNRANPVALIRSAALMLEYIGEKQAAEAIETAVGEVLSEGGCRTRDIGGTASTTDMTEAVISALGKGGVGHGRPGSGRPGRCLRGPP